MTAPPWLAILILDRFAPRDEELAGDLVEEYQSGRSRAWFWQQVLVAIAIGAARSVRIHFRRTAGAILVGSFLSVLGDAAFARAVESLGDFVTWTWLLSLLVSTLVIGTEQFIIGAVVGRLARPVGPPIALVYAAILLGASAINFVLFMTGDAARGFRLLAGSQFVVTLCVALFAAVFGTAWAAGSGYDRRAQRW